MKKAIVRVPATTANLGPGFDTLGIALQLYNRVEVVPTREKGVRILSPISEQARSGATSMFRDVAKAFFRASGRRSFGVDVSISGDVPIARGLGSSVTARLGLAAALNRLCGDPLDRSALLDVVAQLEHHPDNAAPAVLGGFCAAGMHKGRVTAVRFQVDPSLHFVTLIPRFEVSTEKARRLVPEQFSKMDTVHNLNRAALLTALFASGRYTDVEDYLEDRVHQPYRRQLIPQLDAVIAAGRRAGAIGGWLSGSGSTIICLTLAKAENVRKGMQNKLPDSDCHILRADNDGMQLTN